MAILANVGNANVVLELGEVQAATRTLGLEAAIAEIRRAEDIDPAFEALKGRAEALYVVAERLVFTNRARIHTLAMAARLPAIYNSRKYIELKNDLERRVVRSTAPCSVKQPQLEPHALEARVSVVWHHFGWSWAKVRVVGYQHFVPS